MGTNRSEGYLILGRENGMSTEVETTGRDAVLVEEPAQIRVMGQPILEALPSRRASYDLVDPFILVHEGRVRLADFANIDTRHPHRGFDNLWYLIEGSVSTGHSTGPGGAMERARLSEGALLALRTGRGVWHAEAIGADERKEGEPDAEFRGVLFWVNLARKDKQVDPSAQVVQPAQIPVRHEGDASQGAGRRRLSGAAGNARADPRCRIAHRRAGHPSGAARVPGLRLRARGQGYLGANLRLARPPQLVLLGPGRVRGDRRGRRHPLLHDR